MDIKKIDIKTDSLKALVLAFAAGGGWSLGAWIVSLIAHAVGSHA